MIPVTQLKQGSSAQISAIKGGDEFKRKLRVIGIREGKMVEVVALHPLGGPMVVQVDGRKTTLGRKMAQRILVEVG